MATRAPTRDEELKRLWRIIREIQSSRSRRSITTDLRLPSKYTIQPYDVKGLKRWIRYRGVGVDIRGLDDPSSRLKMLLRMHPRRHKLVYWVPRLEKADLDTILWTLETEQKPIDYTDLFNARYYLLKNEIDKYNKAIDILNRLKEKKYTIKIVRYLRNREDFDRLTWALRKIANFDRWNYTWIIDPDKMIKNLSELGRVQQILDTYKDALEAKVVDSKGSETTTVDPVDIVEKLSSILRDNVGLHVTVSNKDTRYYYISPDIVSRLTPEKIYGLATYTRTVYDPDARKQVEKAYTLYRETYNGGVMFPRGIVPRLAKLVNEYVEQHPEEPNIIIQPYMPSILEAFKVKSPVKLRPYQAEAVISILDYLTRYGGATLQAATGAGKTEIAIDVLKRILDTYNKDIVVRELNGYMLGGIQKAPIPGDDIKVAYGRGPGFKPSVVITIPKDARIERHENLDEGIENIYVYTKNYIYTIEYDMDKKKITIKRRSKPRKVFFMSLSTDLLRQFRARAQKYGIPVGLVTADEFDIDKPVIAVTVQSMYRALQKVYREKPMEKIEKPEDIKIEEYDVRDPRKLVELFRDAILLIFDEVQHVPASTVKYTVKHAPYALKLGLSATPWRDDERDLEIYAWIGDVVPRKITSSELIEHGYLVPAHILVVTYHNPLYDSIDKELARVKTGARRYRIVQKTVYYLEDRNKWIADTAKKLKELGFVPGLVLVREKKHGSILEKLFRERGLKTYFVSGDIRPKERERIFNLCREGKLDYIIATSLADEGLDLPPLKTLILTAGGKSKVKTLQRIGRVIRPWPGKKVGLVIDIVDDIRYFKDHIARRYIMYKTEPKWKIEFIPKDKLPEKLEIIKKMYT